METTPGERNQLFHNDQPSALACRPSASAWQGNPYENRDIVPIFPAYCPNPREPGQSVISAHSLARHRRLPAGQLSTMGRTVGLSAKNQHSKRGKYGPSSTGHTVTFRRRWPPANMDDAAVAESQTRAPASLGPNRSKRGSSSITSSAAISAAPGHSPPKPGSLFGQNKQPAYALARICFVRLRDRGN